MSPPRKDPTERIAVVEANMENLEKRQDAFEDRHERALTNFEKRVTDSFDTFDARVDSIPSDRELELMISKEAHRVVGQHQDKYHPRGKTSRIPPPATGSTTSDSPGSPDQVQRRIDSIMPILILVGKILALLGVGGAGGVALFGG